MTTNIKQIYCLELNHFIPPPPKKKKKGKKKNQKKKHFYNDIQ